MNVIRSFTLKSLRQNKKRTIVTIIGVTISTAMILAVAVFVTSLVSMIQRSTIADGGNWHAKIMDVPAENISAITNSNAVDAAALSKDLGFATIDAPEAHTKKYYYVRQYGESGFDQMSIRLVSGRMPESSGEVLISSSLTGNGTVNTVGSILDLDIGEIVMTNGIKVEGNDYIPAGYDDQGNEVVSPVFTVQRSDRFAVVGVMEPPSFESSWSTGYGVLGLIDESALSQDGTVDIFITAKNINRDIYEDIPALANQAAASGGVEFNNELLRYYGVVRHDNVYLFLQGFMAVIILIIMISSISLIYNAFAISVAERSKQLGLLASVGATKRQKRVSVYYEGFLIGLIGVPLGILAGIGGSAITVAAIQPLMDSFLTVATGIKLTLIVPPLAVAAAVGLSAVTIFMSAWIPARRASKITPIDAIRLTKEVRLTHSAVRTSGLVRKLFGFEAEIALKNLKRSRKRYRATILSLVISLVLFLTVSTYTSITTRLSGASYEGYNFDIAVYYHSAFGPEQEQINKRIAALEQVNELTLTSTLTGSVSLDADQLTDPAKEYTMYQSGIAPSGKIDFIISVVGLDDESFIKYADEAGLNSSEFTDAVHPKAILINYGQSNMYIGENDFKKVAGNILRVDSGDTLLFTAGDPKEAGEYSESVLLTIGAVTDKRPIGVLTGELSRATFIVSDDVWNSIAGSFSEEKFEQLKGYSAISYESYMTTSDDQYVEKQIAQLTEGKGVNVFNLKSASRSEQNLQLFLGVFVYGFIILISLISIANIFNTVSTNIALRRREFAMLRSVGMTPRSFGSMIRFESIFYGLKGLLYGLPISVAVAFLLFGMQQSVLTSTFTLPWVSYGVAVLMILVIVFSTMLYSTSKIKKENILDALKEETT